MPITTLASLAPLLRPPWTSHNMELMQGVLRTLFQSDTVSNVSVLYHLLNILNITSAGNSFGYWHKRCFLWLTLSKKKAFVNKHLLFEPILIIILKIIQSERLGYVVSQTTPISVVYDYKGFFLSHSTYAPKGSCCPVPCLLHPKPRADRSSLSWSIASLRAKGKGK